MAPGPDFATKPTISGRLVTLRPFRPGDAEVMAQIIADPEVRRLTGSVESTAEAEHPDVVLDEVDLVALTGNLRVLIGPGGRERGLGTEAVGLATAYGVERLGLRRITLEVFEFNPRARRVYEKVGYVVTGVRPGALVFDGVEVAAVDMAVDAGHWPGFPADRSG